MNSVDNAYITYCADGWTLPGIIPSSGSKRPAEIKISDLAEKSLSESVELLKKQNTGGSAPVQPSAPAIKGKTFYPKSLYLKLISEADLKKIEQACLSFIEQWNSTELKKYIYMDNVFEEVKNIIGQLKLNKKWVLLVDFIYIFREEFSSWPTPEKYLAEWKIVLHEECNKALNEVVGRLYEAGKCQECLNLLMKVASLDVELQPEYFSILIRLLMTYHRYDECFKFLVQALEKHRVTPIFDNDTLIKLTRTKIKLHLKKQNFDKAYECAGTLKSIVDPFSLKYLYGYIALKWGKYDIAHNYFAKVIKNPGDTSENLGGTPEKLLCGILRTTLFRSGKLLVYDSIRKYFPRLEGKKILSIMHREKARYFLLWSKSEDALNESIHALKYMPNSGLATKSYIQSVFLFYACDGKEIEIEQAETSLQKIDIIKNKLYKILKLPHHANDLSFLLKPLHRHRVIFYLFYAQANFESARWTKYLNREKEKVDTLNKCGLLVLRKLEEVLPDNPKVSRLFEKYCEGTSWMEAKSLKYSAGILEK